MVRSCGALSADYSVGGGSPELCNKSSNRIVTIVGVGSMQNLTQEKIQSNFNFDEWLELSRRDPESFESRRLASIEEFINSVPEDKQHRLRCLQWKIDRVREKMPTPLAACVAISDMMWDSLDRLNQLYHDCESVTSGNHGKRTMNPLPNAEIIKFMPRQ